MRGRLFAYVLAAGATVLALALRAAIDPWLDAWLPFITCYAAIAVSVGFGGLGPGLLAAVLGFGGAAWMFLGPDWLLGPWGSTQAMALFAYGLSSAVVIGFGVALRRGRARLLAEQLRLQEQAAELQRAERSATEQRRALEAIVQASPPALIVVDVDPPLVRVWNPAAEQLFGWRADEVIGRELPIVPGEKRAECRHCRDLALSGDAPHELATWRRHRDGRRVDVRLSASAVPDADGRLARVLFVMSDAAEARRAARADARLAAVMRDAHDAVLALSLDGRIEACNPAGRRLLGLGDDDALGQPLEAFAPPGGEAVLRGCLQRVREGDTVDAELGLLARGGEHVEVQLRLAPMREGDGSGVGLSALMQDITERKCTERALRESEAVLRSFCDNAPVMMGVVEPTDDGDLLHVYDNPLTCDLFGLPRGGTALRLASELAVDRETLAQWLAHYRLSGQRGEPVSFDYRLRTVQGPRWFSATVSPIGPGPSGRARFCYVSQDITERHVDRARIEESEQRARLAMQVARLGTWTFEPAGDALQADERTREVVGAHAQAALTGAALLERVHAEDRPRVREALARALDPAGSGVYAEEMRFVHGDGTLRWAAVRAQTLFEGVGAQRRAGLLMGTLLDITQDKHLQQELERADRRKDEFIATLAHELRNPLAPLRNGLQLVRMVTRGQPAVERPLGIMERQLAQMVRLIDDLLDLARVTSDKIELRRAPVDLLAAVQQAVESSRPEIDAAGHTLTLTVPAHPLWVDGDLTRLTQVIANLLSNAAKYTPAHGRIRLDLHEHGDGQVLLSVSDNGIGLAEDERESIFEMFGQVDRSLERTQGGLGIGLAIARRLSEMHGGRLHATSAGPGQGSRFELRLPRLGARLQATPETMPVGGAAREPRPESRRVLVADDNVDAAESLAEILEMMGHRTRVAHDGQQALAVAADFAPEVVLLDLGMPRLNGYETARRLREQPGGDRLLLIALTGWGQAEDRRRSSEAGFDSHVVKPVAPEGLQALLSAWPARRAA